MRIIIIYDTSVHSKDNNMQKHLFNVLVKKKYITVNNINSSDGTLKKKNKTKPHFKSFFTINYVRDG